MSILIYNCNIICCVSEGTQQDGWVLLEGEQIAKIGSGQPMPAADEAVDAQGGYLLPGLINLHAHINRRHLSRGTGVFRQGAPAVENASDGKRILYAARNAWYELSQGITTIRDLCSVGRTASELKAAISEGIIHGPRLSVCGMGIAATGGHETHRYRGAVEVDGANEVTKAVRYEIKLGADFIKVMASGGLGGMPEHEHPSWSELTQEEIAAACQAAHSHNRTVTVHAMGEKPVLNALLGGVDGIEHGAVLTEQALTLMAERGVYYVPTMSGITTVADKEEASGSPELAAMMRELVIFPQRESVKKAHQSGILIGAGSDTLGSVLEELRLLHGCGLSNYEALLAATANAAKILGWEDRIGTLEEGKLADLLLVRENPLENLAHLSDVQAVFLGGERVSEAWMCKLQ